MKYLSWKIKPFALYHEIREISRIFNFSPEEIESILKELEDENKIFPLTAEGPRDIHYMLKADIQLQLLIDMKKSPQNQLSSSLPGFLPQITGERRVGYHHSGLCTRKNLKVNSLLTLISNRYATY